MHMHGHLKDSILDFGPVQEFWLFSYERYNGILGNQPNNNRLVEPQLIQRFLRDNFAVSFEYPSEFRENFSSIVVPSNVVGSLGDTLSTPTTTQHEFPSKFSRGVFDADSLDVLKTLFCKINPEYSDDEVTVNSIYLKYASFTYNNKTFLSSGCRRHRMYLVNALWKENLYGTALTTLPDSDRLESNIRPVNVHYYIKSTFVVNDTPFSLCFAYVSWLFPHPKQYFLGKPVELWCNMQESFGLHSFIPLDTILCRCGYGTRLHDGENLLVVVSLVE